MSSYTLAILKDICSFCSLMGTLLQKNVKGLDCFTQSAKTYLMPEFCFFKFVLLPQDSTF